MSNWLKQIWRATLPHDNRKLPHSLCHALELGLIPKQYLTEVMSLLNSYPYPRKPNRGIPARSEYNDPSWDNAVRILEDNVR